MQLSNKGLAIIQQFEGFSAKPYHDVKGVCTIGFGCTYYTDGTPVKMTDKPLTRQQAVDLQLAVLNKDFVPKIANLMQPQINSGFVTQNMFDACCSLTYNIGINGFAGSSVLRNIKAGNKQAAADAFLPWNKSGGKVVQGLINRRNAERKLFLS